MQINHLNSKRANLSDRRIQDEILPFAEMPSDKHNVLAADVNYEEESAYEKDNKRRNPFELFSLFTADIIKENVVYTK